jgi:hypothetical protein
VSGATLSTLYRTNSTLTYASGALSESGSTFTVTASCSSAGAGVSSFSYSASPTAVDVTEQIGSYVAVATYTKM